MLFSFTNQTKSTILCAKEDSDQILGFICGSNETKNFYSQLLKRIPTLLIPLIKSILKEEKILKKIIVKSFSILTKKQANSNVNQHDFGEIYSLAVHEQASRKGVGSRLLNEYIKQEKYSSSKKGVFITTDNNSSNKAVIDFYKKNKFKHTSDFIQYPSRKMSIYTYHFTDKET
ncbi:GNAT family N-acetyltransferase [Candidatus Thiothrix anitrata]|uniref:GNAT family N-acetyltransferase n=1 Tax=Candidatus Thiothrix anitrata TaxID=2823902 RepID=A0ABX7X973_9GAMM|nr:GNAT family N-acetyltransferase [Candidatus Thiothrix anitrata]